MKRVPQKKKKKDVQLQMYFVESLDITLIQPTFHP